MPKTPAVAAASKFIPGKHGGTNVPVALGLGGVAALLIISGIQGKSMSDVLSGDFGTMPKPVPPGGGEGLSVPGKGTEDIPENIPKGLISPFKKNANLSWGRSDQGIDGNTDPGSPLLAMGSGTVTIAHNCPGFGCNYPVLHIDGDGSFYYGHSVPIVASGTRVTKGQPIARANTNGQGNANSPGSFEIGRWPPGSMSAGDLIRKWFVNLPRI